MNEGWRCPGCGRCYAPFVSKCEQCGAFTSEPLQMPLPDALEKAPKKMREEAEKAPRTSLPVPDELLRKLLERQRLGGYRPRQG